MAPIFLVIGFNDNKLFDNKRNLLNTYYYRITSLSIWLKTCLIISSRKQHKSIMRRWLGQSSNRSHQDWLRDTEACIWRPFKALTSLAFFFSLCAMKSLNSTIRSVYFPNKSYTCWKYKISILQHNKFGNATSMNLDT